MLVVEIFSVPRCAFNCLFHESTIFRMRALNNHVESDGTRLVVSKNSEEFFGAEAFSSSNIPDEAAGLAHSLGFGQFRFASPQLFLGPLAVLNIGRRPVPFDNDACLVAQRLGLEQKPTIFAIKAPEPSFKSTSHTGLPYCAPLLQHTFLVVRMKRARPASFGLVRWTPGVVARWLIEEVGDPFRSGAPDQCRDGTDDRSKAILRFLEIVKSSL